MTIISSSNYDSQFVSAVLRRLTVQINSDAGTSLLVSNHYDTQFIPAMLKRIVDAINANYSGSIISSQHYDDQFIAEVLQRCVDKVNAGAGDVPVWVPANAKIYIDLVNDRAWTEADGEVAINTLLGTDANTENAWDVSSYDQGNLTEDGYVTDGETIALIGTARVMLVDEATIVYRTKNIVGDPQNSISSAGLVAANGNDALQIDVEFETTFYSWNGSASGSLGRSVNDGVNGAINVAAVTITGDRMDMALNGSDPVHLVLDETDRPPGNPLVAFFLSPNANALQSITIYDALPSTAGLSALSETGVTNTAPHDMTWEWWDSTTEATGTIPSPVTAGNNLLTLNGVTDAEGNPVTWSLVADDTPDAQLIVGEQASNAVSTRNDGAGLAPGTYHFTVRATDPGGLYVEQEFTITVTA